MLSFSYFEAHILTKLIYISTYSLLSYPHMAGIQFQFENENGFWVSD